MDPARGRSDASRHIFEKCDDIVIRALLDLVDLRNGEVRALANLHRVRLRDLPDLRHRFAGESFDLEPNLEFSLLGPELAHRRAGISINHRLNIESRGTAAKRFVQKETSLGRTDRRSDASRRMRRKVLANPSAIEAPVALYAHLATAEQIGDGRDRFLGVLGAGAHREDEFAKRQGRTSFQDLGSLFHVKLTIFQQIGCHCYYLDCFRCEMFKSSCHSGLNERRCDTSVIEFEHSAYSAATCYESEVRLAESRSTSK